MTRHSLLLLLPLLAACTVTERPPGEGPGGSPLGLFFPPAAEPVPPAPAPLPPAVAAALPPGVPPSVVLQDNAGCYLYSIERTDPPSGFPIRDAAGQPICEGGAAPGLAPAAPLPGAVVADASGLEPVAPPPPVASAPIGASPLQPGGIAPPAPLAPLNP